MTYHVLGDHLHILVESLQMPGEEGEIDGVQRHGLGETNGKGGEPSLQSRIDFERAGRGVHASDQLGVANVLHGQFEHIIHVFVFQLLSK